MRAAVAAFSLILLGATNPSPIMTPGEADPKCSAKNICVVGYTTKVRNVTQRMKKQVCAAYGKKDSCPTGYEIDHYISLELCGMNSFKNLWPQPMEEARKKDVIETDLHRRVCKGLMKLDEAQLQIQHWEVLYTKFKAERKK